MSRNKRIDNDEGLTLTLWGEYKAANGRVVNRSQAEIREGVCVLRDLDNDRVIVAPEIDTSAYDAVAQARDEAVQVHRRETDRADALSAELDAVKRDAQIWIAAAVAGWGGLIATVAAWVAR